MADQINVNAIANTLQTKVDLPDGVSQSQCDFVIARKSPTAQDPTWYRMYKSGWVEQGGWFVGTSNGTAKVITLPITMSDTNYSGYGISQCNSATDTGASQSYRSCFLKTSTTQITVSQTNTWTTQWEVNGFAATTKADGGDDEATLGNVYKTYFYSGCELDYSNAEDLTAGTTTVMTRAGAVLFMAQGNASTHTYTGTINGLQVFWSGGYNESYYDTSPQLCSVSVGDAVFATAGINTYKFIPYKESAPSTDITITTLINAIYPVGSIYIGTTVNCPIASIVGTWTKIDEDLVLQSSSSTHPAGTTIAAGLPNITGGADVAQGQGYDYRATGAFAKVGGSGGNWDTGASCRLDFNASRSNPIYGNSDTVQPPAYVVNIWKRTA